MNQLKNDKVKIGIIAAVVLAIAVFAFWPKPRVDEVPFYFHPDAVQSLSWEIGGKTWKFERADRSSMWNPIANIPAMQNRLAVLGTADHLEKMSAPSPGLKVSFHFGPLNSGEGVYNDGRFVWTSGLKKGYGFIATGKAQDVLEEGRYAFGGRTWTWCSERPQYIKTSQFNIWVEKGQWYSGDKKSPRKLDSTTVEKWLGRNCSVLVDYFKDREAFVGLLKRLTDMSDADKLELGFKTPVTYVKKGNYWLVNEKMGVNSRQFDEALEFISQLSQKKN